jgi:hypothetical protein
VFDSLARHHSPQHTHTVSSNALRQFAKGGWSATNAKLQQQKAFVYGVTRLSLSYAKRGAGQSGVRSFKYDVLPAIKYWNPDLVCEVVKDVLAAPTAAPRASVQLTLADGSTRSFDATGLSAAQIVAELRPFTTNPKPLSQLFANKSN